MFEGFDDKIVLITGGTGSLGSALVSLLHLKYKPKKIIVFSRDECKQQAMQRQLGNVIPELRFRLGDVQHYRECAEVTRDVDFVFHTAALKHIDKIEENPELATMVNVVGTMNVVNACCENQVKRAAFVSTDKACEPLVAYGFTKGLAEKIWLARNRSSRCKFVVVKYGNVLASRGSVIETWLDLKAQGIHEFEITDPECTRFWITLPQAAEAVVAAMMSGIPISIPRVPAMKMTDAAKAVDPECTFKIVGMRGSEKVHECLVSPNERVPGFENGYYSNMAPQLAIDEFRRMLRL